MKVTVDSSKCQGHGRCANYCPELFDLDEEGYVSLLAENVPPELGAAARQAAGNCPEHVITLGG
ncbi:MAG TPA: ferredoxin [Trebonia sp.]|jgi:ferredoxin